MAIKNDGGAKSSAANAARKVAEESRKRSEAQAAQARASAAAAAKKPLSTTKAVAFKADELSAGRGGALRANATKLLGASGLSSTVATTRVEPPPPASPTQTYEVKPGDTLTAIADKFQTTVPELQRLNNLSDPNAIYAGQKLTVPGTAPVQPPADAWQGTYKVKPGDTLTSIASKFQTTVDELVAHNGIKDPNNVWVGTELHVPGAPATGGAAPVAPTGNAVPPSSVLGAQVADLAKAEQAAWANDPNAAKYWQYGTGNPEAWCADFVSTVYGKAAAPLGEKGVGFASVPSMVEWFQKGPTQTDPRARSFLPGTDMPRVGDVVVMDWDGNGTADHTGIVTAVRDDGSFDTIEGNTNGDGEWDGEVGSHTYSSREKILGFGRMEGTPKPTSYTLTKDDSSLWNVASKLGVNYHALVQANPGIDPAAIKPGQVLVVPTFENTPAQAPAAPAEPRTPPYRRGPNGPFAV